MWKIFRVTEAIYIYISFLIYNTKKGSPVNVAPACAGSDHFGPNARSISLHFCTIENKLKL
jgi:hypothetical protein